MRRIRTDGLEKIHNRYNGEWDLDKSPTAPPIHWSVEELAHVCDALADHITEMEKRVDFLEKQNKELTERLDGPERKLDKLWADYMRGQYNDR